MRAATLGVAEALPPVSDAIGVRAAPLAKSCFYRLPEELVMPLKTPDVIGRL
jgi:hypothetical protein